MQQKISLNVRKIPLLSQTMHAITLIYLNSAAIKKKIVQTDNEKKCIMKESTCAVMTECVVEWQYNV